jgi:medium-chain acyl-[acyl-carrier-protein] hydrolase
MQASIGTQSYFSTPWITCFKPRPEAKVRLFCFPYAGGGSAIFRSWVDRVPQSIEICPVQLPGRESRLAEVPFDRLPALVPVVAEAIVPYLDKPFGFFGHSMGALISFELSRRLRRDHDLQPAHLFVSGRWPPHKPRLEERTSDLPEEEFIQELRSLNGTPKEVLEHPALMALMLPMLRADFAVCETYSYTDDTPLSCPITVFGGLQDEPDRDSLEPWRDQTTAAFSLRMLPGDHFFVHTAQSQLIRVISRELV